MADPRWLDPAIDPNERTPGTCYLGDPQVVNMSPVGLARFCTLRSWLSQWSYDDANGDGVRCGRDIGHPDKEIHVIPGANHYYAGPDQRPRLQQAVATGTDWPIRHDFAGPQ